MPQLMTARECAINLWTYVNLIKMNSDHKHDKYLEESLDRMISYAESLMISLKTQPDISIHEWNEVSQCLQCLAYSQT